MRKVLDKAVLVSLLVLEIIKYFEFRCVTAEPTGVMTMV
jgi:hypothetical protein